MKNIKPAICGRRASSMYSKILAKLVLKTLKTIKGLRHMKMPLTVNLKKLKMKATDK